MIAYPTPESFSAANSESINEAFRWLLILGFPASTAAATVCPEIFRDEPVREGDGTAWRANRLLVV